MHRNKEYWRIELLKDLIQIERENGNDNMTITKNYINYLRDQLNLLLSYKRDMEIENNEELKLEILKEFQRQMLLVELDLTNILKISEKVREKFNIKFTPLTREEIIKRAREELVENKKEYILSDKRFNYNFNNSGEWVEVDEGQEYYMERDIKESINLIKRIIWDTMGKDIEKREKILMEIEKLVGDKDD